MLAPLFLFAALASNVPASAIQPRLTVIAVDSAAQPISDDGFSDKLRYTAEQRVARIVATELSLRQDRIVSDGTPAQYCANDGTEYVLTVQAVTGFAPGPESGAATVSAQLLRCPSTLVGQAVESRTLRTGATSLSELFSSLAAQAAFRIVDGMHPTHRSVTDLRVAAKSRVSIIASSIGIASADADRAIAETRVVNAVESGLGMIEVATVTDGSVSNLCAGNATDYVLSVEAAVGPDYQIIRSTPPTFPGPVPTFLTMPESTPQVSAALLRCPGIIVATSQRHAWVSTAGTSPPISTNRFSAIAQSVADELLAQIPADHS